jgi:two-component system chemotaxis sensor kinase CheA
MNQRDIDELTEVFVEESQEIVESLNKDVLTLEQSVGNPNLDRELLNNIFRYVHTLKGNSGLAGADKLRDLAHKMESLLDRLRKDKLALSAEIVDILFHGIDRIGSILQEIIGGEKGVVIEDLIDKLDAILGSHAAEEAAGTPSEGPVKEKTKHAPPLLFGPPMTQPSAPSELSLYAIPEDIKRILSEYEENRFLESIRNHLPIYELILNLMIEGFERMIKTLIGRINTAGEVIAQIPDPKTLPNYDLRMRIIFASSHSAQELTALLMSLPDLVSQDFTIKLLIEGVKKTPPIEKPVPPPPKPAEPKPAVKKEGASKPERQKPPVVVPSSQAKSAPKETAETVSPKTISIKDLSEQAGNTVRVDIKKLDNLMNIVGELVLAKARYVQFEAELEGFSAYNKMLQEHFKRNNKFTSKKLEDLREGILQVRMVQVGSLFNRFPRIVRDLAKSHNKQIQLILEGQETELDKAVIDEMGDPLMHLIRNAVDHGIEDQQTRRRRGKPDMGTVTLRSYQEGSSIVIEMEDDGGGMDIDRLRDKAIELGLVDRGMKLSEFEILNFIFQPGFSTAKVVTNTSGRGVGMDAVKAAITRLKGIIDIRTAVNVGTKFIIKLPLTLAIIQVLLIKINQHTYAIPLSSVIESFRLNPQKIELIDEQEVTQLRHHVLPLLRLHEVFRPQDDELPDDETQPDSLSLECEPDSKEPSPEHREEPPPEPYQEELLEQRQFVVVIGLADKRIGLVVDELLGQQEIVIKPLGRYLVNIPGFAGATTLGDGRVVLILDVVGLIENLNKKRIGPKIQQERQAVVAFEKEMLNVGC